MIGDKGYEAKYLRLFLESRGTISVIDPPALVMIVSAAVKPHHSAAGEKGEEKKQAIGRSRGERRKSMRLSMKKILRMRCNT